MNLDFMKTMISGAKNLLGKKSTQEILKYIATVSLNYASKKYNVDSYKYDSNDMKNMVYHHNMNNNELINKDDVEMMTHMLSIDRFLNEIEDKGETMPALMYNLTKLMNDGKVIETYNNIFGNNLIQKFDHDVLETSALVDSYEINSGGIYLPDRTIVTQTKEGNALVDAKNDYLESRMELGENASQWDINNLINEYKERIEFDKVLQYFNN